MNFDPRATSSLMTLYDVPVITTENPMDIARLVCDELIAKSVS